MATDGRYELLPKKEVIKLERERKHLQANLAGIKNMNSVQLLKSRLPHAYLVYIWDAAHSIEVDQPERMLAVLTSFLQRSEGFMVNWGTLAVNPG